MLNAFREIHAAYFFLKEVIKLDGADLAYNRKHWPNTKPPLPRADVYTMSLQPQCTLILAEADLPERRARYFDYRWDFDSPRRENIVDKRHRWEGNASKDLMERSENDLERGLKKYLGYWGGMPAGRNDNGGRSGGNGGGNRAATAAMAVAATAATAITTGSSGTPGSNIIT